MLGTFLPQLKEKNKTPELLAAAAAAAPSSAILRFVEYIERWIAYIRLKIVKLNIEDSRAYKSMYVYGEELREAKGHMQASI